MGNIHPEVVEAMRAIEPLIANIVKKHRQQQRLWFPSELVPIDHTPELLPPTLLGTLVLNLLTEDGLPYFFALLVIHLGYKGAIWEWNRMWTAEENRHGDALKYYLRRALPTEQLLAVEKMQYAYQIDGFWPDWSLDPFKLLAYVVLQEQATQLSHAGIARQAIHFDPILVKMMGKISGEEYKHHLAYLEMFKGLYAINPNHTLYALQFVAENFSMPGASIPGFKHLSDLQQRLKFFGPLEFSNLITELWENLSIGSTLHLTEVGEKAREEISGRIRRLHRFGERLAEQKPKTIPLEFLGTTVTV